jgi:hypothetical protein
VLDSARKGRGCHVLIIPAACIWYLRPSVICVFIDPEDSWEIVLGRRRLVGDYLASDLYLGLGTNVLSQHSVWHRGYRVFIARNAMSNKLQESQHQTSSRENDHIR